VPSLDWVAGVVCGPEVVLCCCGAVRRRWCCWRWVVGLGDGPAPGCVVQAQGGQSCEVDGAGSGQDVGQDAGVSAAAGFSAAPGAVGEVADLAFHDGAMGAVGLLPDGVFLASFGVL
jgi:hypothetical protein